MEKHIEYSQTNMTLREMRENDRNKGIKTAIQAQVINFENRKLVGVRSGVKQTE